MKFSLEGNQASWRGPVRPCGSMRRRSVIPAHRNEICDHVLKHRWNIFSWSHLPHEAHGSSSASYEFFEDLIPSLSLYHRQCAADGAGAMAAAPTGVNDNPVFRPSRRTAQAFRKRESVGIPFSQKWLNRMSLTIIPELLAKTHSS